MNILLKEYKLIVISKPRFACIREFSYNKRIIIESSAGVEFEVKLKNDITGDSFPMSLDNARNLITELGLAIEEYETEKLSWGGKQ